MGAAGSSRNPNEPNSREGIKTALRFGCRLVVDNHAIRMNPIPVRELRRESVADAQTTVLDDVTDPNEPNSREGIKTCRRGVMSTRSLTVNDPNEPNSREGIKT